MSRVVRCLVMGRTDVSCEAADQSGPLWSIIQYAFQMSAAVGLRGSIWRSSAFHGSHYWCKMVYELWCWGVKTYTLRAWWLHVSWNCSLLCIDSWNGIEKCHLQCRSLTYNAAVVSWIESIVSLTQSVLYYPCGSSTMDTLSGTSILISFCLVTLRLNINIREKKNLSISHIFVIRQCFSDW